MARRAIICYRDWIWHGRVVRGRRLIGGDSITGHGEVLHALDERLAFIFLAAWTSHMKFRLLCNMERELYMVIKVVPFEMKQSMQIGIAKEFAISFVVFLLPTSVLAILSHQYQHPSQHFYTVVLIVALLYRSTRKTST
jgi:hypothetical protein